jgi:hypothetical protein
LYHQSGWPLRYTTAPSSISAVILSALTFCRSLLNVNVVRKNDARRADEMRVFSGTISSP